jgi:uncharacterized protein YjhX (UPF0386 family)
MEISVDAQLHDEDLFSWNKCGCNMEFFSKRRLKEQSQGGDPFRICRNRNDITL